MSVSQTSFHTALLDPDAAIPKGLSDGLGQPAGNRFSVYRNNVAASLTEALELSFPAIVRLLGAENFKSIAGVFLRKHPPKTPIMMHYGADFPDFLQGFEPLSHLAYLADVAHLEQAIRLSYHAADAKAIAPDSLQEIPPEALPTAQLEIAPSAQIIRSTWPVHAIWAFNMENGPKPKAVAQDVIVLRPAFDPQLSVIDEGTAHFIQALQAGHTLGDANEIALNTQAGFDLSQAIGLLLDGQAITNIKTGETT